MADELNLTAQRLRERMDEVGIDQLGLAHAVGVEQSTISNILTGRTRNSRHLPRIANNLAVNLDWLLGLTVHKIEMLDLNDEPINEAEYRERLKAAEAKVSSDARGYRFAARSGESKALAAEQLDMVAVQEIDLAYGMGGQYLDVQTVQESTVWFPGAFLRQYTKSAPEHLRFCRGDGDSMVPTIGHHDIVLFDMSQNHLNRQNAIWVVAVADIGMIKRVRAEPDGSYILMSDNKLVDPQVVVDGEMHVIGRVVAVIRGM